MKRILLVISVTVLLGAAGFLIFHIVVGRTKDVSLKSEDGTAELLLKDATTSKCTRVRNITYCFHLKEGKNLYRDYIIDNPDYLYSLDEHYRISDLKTGRYLLCVNQRYFYIEDKEDCIWYQEMAGSFYPPERRGGTMISPVVDADGFAHAKVNFFRWEETAGLCSFADLVAFYQRVQPELYEVDEGNQDIYLSLYSGKWYPRGAKIHATEDGIEVTLITETENPE